MAHKRYPPKRRKVRGPLNLPDSNPLSDKLRETRNLIRRGRFEEALTLLSGLAAANASGTARMKITSLIADLQMKQGHFAAAAQTYQAAGHCLNANEATDWFRPAFGEVLALLKDCQIADAATRANAVLATADSKEAYFASQLQQTVTVVASGLPAEIRRRPARASVVASRLGHAFLAEGELTTAKSFFDAALARNGNGACRARIGLALAAERENDSRTAARRAREALVVGQCHAKTISAWPILVRALASNGDVDGVAALLPSLAQAQPAVRARAILTIVRTLRSRHATIWQRVAHDWLAAEGTLFPAIASEIRKILLSDIHLARGSASAISTAAAALLATPQLAPREWLCAIKRHISASLRAGLAVDVQSFFNQGIQSYGGEWALKLSHGLLKGCSDAGRPELAKPLLETAVASSATSPDWAKAILALARIERLQKNFGRAANLYSQCCGQLSIPVRYRLAARLKRINCLLEIDDSQSILSEKEALVAELNQGADYESFLDTARKLVYAPPELNALAIELLEIGRTRARQQLNVTASPSVAVTLLFRISRREADFAKYDDTISVWLNFASKKIDWLWSPGEEFWQYVSLVAQAFRNSGRPEQAEQLLTGFLQDPATPTNGQAILGVLSALVKVNTNRFQEALRDFRRYTSVNPRNPTAAYGYYWLALDEWRQSHFDAALEYGRQLEAALGSNLGLKWKAALKHAAIWIAARFDPRNVPSNCGYKMEALQAAFDRAKIDLQRLSGG